MRTGGMDMRSVEKERVKQGQAVLVRTAKPYTAVIAGDWVGLPRGCEHD